MKKATFLHKIARLNIRKRNGKITERELETLDQLEGRYQKGTTPFDWAEEMNKHEEEEEAFAEQ